MSVVADEHSLKVHLASGWIFADSQNCKHRGIQGNYESEGKVKEAQEYKEGFEECLEWVEGDEE